MAETSVNTRLEAFCDGVFAIALTLLIIDIKIPSPERIGSTLSCGVLFGTSLPRCSRSS